MQRQTSHWPSLGSLTARGLPISQYIMYQCSISRLLKPAYTYTLTVVLCMSSTKSFTASTLILYILLELFHIRQ